MQRHAHVRVMAILMCTALVACEQTPSQAPLPIRPEEVVQSPPPLYAYPLAAPQGFAEQVAWGRLPEGPIRDRSREEAQRLFRAGARRGYELSRAFIEQTKTHAVEVALAATQQQLQAEAGMPHQSYTEQVLATRLLNHYLAQGQLPQVAPRRLAQRKLTPDQQKIVGFATTLLIRNHYPNPDLLAAMLTTLKGYWTDERIRTEASQAMQDGEAWLAYKAACTTCAAKNDPIDADLRVRQVQSGLADLQRLMGT